MNRPNILFLFTDQQHFGMMSCAGNRWVSTPAMDSLAAEGVRFDRAYCTNPVCCPSRFSLMTGRMPSESGLLSNYPYWIPNIPESIKKGSLGHRMREAGYQPAYGGKAHMAMQLEETGFDSICKDERGGLADACVQFIEGKHDRPFCLIASFVNPHDICCLAMGDVISDANQRADFMKGIKASGHTLDEAMARPPGVDDEEFFARYCPPLPENFEPQEDEPEAIRFMLEMRPFRMHARRRWTDRQWREHRWAYARLTEQVDRDIGKVLDALRRSPHADDTLIAFSSDHGDMDSAHRMEHKSTIYDEASRIPLILCPPGPRPAAWVDRTHLVSNGLDLLPTFCDYAGVDPGPDLPGRSLRPILEGTAGPNWRAAVPIETAVGRCIVTDRFKYARFDIGESAEQLIDLAADPGEMRNALHDPAYATRLPMLRALFDRTFGPAPRPPALEIFRAAEMA